MKIVSGLGCVDDYIRLVKAGADEFFCGYVPYEWNQKYGVLSPLNRREVLYVNVQIGCMSEMEILHKMVEKYQVPVKITFNSLYYLEEQYEMIAQIIRQLMEIGFDTFIIADLALIQYLREKKIKCFIHLSGETAELNRLATDVFNEFDIKRYIFHRKNTIKDMTACIDYNQEKHLEYEAFILNERCHFTGAFCNSLHCDELPHLCKVPYQMARIEKGTSKFQEVEWKFREHGLMMQDVITQDFSDEMNENIEYTQEEEESQITTGSTGCGLCALMQLKKAGVTHLKLVGRGNHVDSIEQDILQLRKALNLLDQEQEETAFQERMQRELFQGSCSHTCYYYESNPQTC